MEEVMNMLRKIQNELNEQKTTIVYNVERRDIQETRRIGKKGEKPQPITITFTSLGTKIEIFKQRRVLKDTYYYIKEDFPQHGLAKRRELQEQLKTEKEKGNSASIKYDKLIIHSKNNTTIGNKKRTLPTSPNDKDLSHSEPKPQAHKKNKTQTQSGLQKSSSLSKGVIKPGILGFLTTKNHKNQPNDQTNENNKQ
ncbi:unnamed protein product [Euphydryas editha]|uniref:Endonuclease-reverse transcriptase n=1 Tax=Euphydryas editha TaxID=104508 RepID=A0AAU9TQ10_EUPED|nr:unnamed protein product [Euphydryas editha]